MFTFIKILCYLLLGVFVAAPTIEIVNILKTEENAEEIVNDTIKWTLRIGGVVFILFLISLWIGGEF